jgi:crossover junction endodeoxyribonuclease RuvC
MRVLGIDCGTERTGYGVIESDGRDHRLIAFGVIRTQPRHPMPVRLAEIAKALRATIAEYQPQAAAIEEVFASVNAKSSLKLAHVRGVAMLAVEEAKLPLGEYSPLVIKASVVGYGRAEKSQVQMMVRSLLRLDHDISSTDAADALAVAICHATRQ